MTVRVVDHGAQALLRATKESFLVKVGVIGDKAAEPAKGSKNPLTIAQIAEIHEFGLGNSPQRSWLRGWIDENASELADTRRKLWKQVISLKVTHSTAALRFGAWAAGQIKKRIATSIPPPNAPSTIARKGSTTTLIDSGQMRGAINYQVTPEHGATAGQVLGRPGRR